MTDNPISLKKVTAADVDTLLALSRKTFFDFFGPLNKPEDMEAYAAVAFTPDKLLTEIKNPGSQFYFAMLNNEVTGYLKLNFGPAQTDFGDSNALEIERIYVSEGHKGKKIGQFLLNYSIQTARENNLQYIWLGVWEHNQNAIGFYQHHGFTVFGSHDFLLGSDLQTDLLMKKEIQ